jgi:crotonobetainyl-CoA:carnitine CoA-transferase CaiB-like acyl-CoA transferase
VLSNVRVLDLTADSCGLAGYLLAQHGADVILVEPLSTAESSSSAESPAWPWRVAFGRGKRSAVLDLNDAAERARFDELLRGADVLLESWSNAGRASLGLTPQQTAAINPRLVHATISPYGIDGPRADWAATDLTIMASASPLAVTGDRDRPPVRMSLPQAYSFGAASAAGAVLVALYEREVSGLGQHVDASAQQAAALATQAGLLAEAVGAPPSIRSAGGASMGRMSLRFLYPAKDGHVSITHVFGEIGGPATARLMAWVHEAGFCSEAVRDKDWIRYAVLIDTGEETVEEWEEIKAAVAAFTSSLPKAKLLRGAIERRLLMAPVSNLDEVLNSPHFAARDFWAPTRDGIGRPLPAPGRYARFSRWKAAPLTDAPRPGQHTAEVLGERREPVPALPETAGTAANHPLSGLKVVDLTWSVAGPAMTRTLADFGATVVKVESIRRLDAARTFLPFWNNQAGIENSALFDNLNAGKHSVSLNIASEQGRAVLDDLIRWADVVVDSFSPRGRNAVGLGDERMRALNATVVSMSVSLFGLDGPLFELAGYGNLGGALSGCYEITGWPDRAPAGPYLAYTDYTSAHLMVVTLMAALLHRKQGGEAQFIELSQAETALQFLAPALVATAATGEVFNRMGNDDLAMAPHGVYPCSGDDRWVAIACQADELWPALCRVIGRSELADDPALRAASGRLQQRARLNEALAHWTSSQAPDVVADRCQAIGIAAYTVQNSAECLADPQLEKRGHIVHLEHPDRDCVVEATRCRLSRTPGAPARHAPLLGEHTFDVLAGFLAYGPDRISDLAAAEILE